MSISTHVLDTVEGRPAPGLAVRLSRRDGGGWQSVAEGQTDSDGRIRELGPSDLAEGEYQLSFATGAYFHAARMATFYPEVNVVFRMEGGASHLHVPLLLSPFGYTTYRGS